MVRVAFRKQLKGGGLPSARVGVNTQAFLLQEQMASEFLLGYRFWRDLTRHICFYATTWPSPSMRGVSSVQIV